MEKEGNTGNKIELINVQMEIWKENNRKNRKKNKWNKAPENKEIFHNKV